MALTALTASQPVDWLTTLGAVRLLHEAGHNVRLRWEHPSEGFASLAVIDGITIDDAAASLTRTVLDLGPDRHLPGVEAEFPPAAGLGADPLSSMAEPDLGWSDEAVRWWKALACPGPVAGSRTTPWRAPRGRQSIRSGLGKTLALLREGGAEVLATRFRKALHGVPEREWGFAGEAFYAGDVQEINHAGPDTRAAPAQTWLALMALPWLVCHPHFGPDGASASARGWYDTGTHRVAAWEVWSTPLTGPRIEYRLGRRFDEVDHLPRRFGGDVVAVPERFAQPDTVGIYAAARRRPGHRTDYFRPLVPIMASWAPERERPDDWSLTGVEAADLMGMSPWVFRAWIASEGKRDRRYRLPVGRWPDALTPYYSYTALSRALDSNRHWLQS